MTTILGLDPGSQIAGFAVIRKEPSGVRWLDSGSLVLPKNLSYSRRLKALYARLSDVFEKHQPQQVAVEKAFFGKNPDSAFKLGQVRGVCLLLAAQYECELHEYAAKRIKKVITGTGAATKEHVQAVVSQMLGTKLTGPFDESDALAIALCHVHEQSVAVKLRSNMGGTP